MRLPATLLALTLLAFPAQAQSFDTPESLIEALYAYDTAETEADAPSPYSPFLSRGLNRLLQADRDATPEGELGALDFDPVINGQDGAAEDIELSPPIVFDDIAELEVSFTNGEPVTLYYTLVRERGSWRVDDIAQQQGEYPWSLRALLGE